MTETESVLTVEVETRRRWSGWSRLGAVAGLAALFLGDEIVFAAPVVYAAGVIGPWSAFLVLTPIYFAIDVLIAWIAWRAYERRVQHRDGESWLARRLVRRAERRVDRTRRFQRRLARGGSRLAIAGFYVLSAWLGGAIVTTLAFRFAGHRRHLVELMGGAAAIYALAFVGQYAGISALIFD